MNDRYTNSYTACSFWRIFAIVALIAFCIIGYMNAINGRYKSFHNAAVVLDSWTGKVYKLDGIPFNYSK